MPAARRELARSCGLRCPCRATTARRGPGLAFKWGRERAERASGGSVSVIQAWLATVTGRDGRTSSDPARRPDTIGYSAVSQQHRDQCS
jgi:hypothetical protein